MKAALQLEYIGADAADLLKMMGCTNTGGPWVAEILGRYQTGKLRRKFLPANRDYSRANSKGSRGVYLCFILESDRLYEVNARVSWKNSSRYFCAVQDSGDLYYPNDEEVEEWLNELSA